MPRFMPSARLVGAFETDFHRTIPPERALYGIPYEWYEKYGIKRMGYHGASHSYVSSVLESLFGSTGRTVSCHLGGSCSLCAIEDGRSVDTSFGFSLQTGVMHANRTGDLDPYVLPYLLELGMGMDEVLMGLSKKGGLLGISGVSNDLRRVQEAAEAGNGRAALAVDMFVNQIVKYAGLSPLSWAGWILGVYRRHWREQRRSAFASLRGAGCVWRGAGSPAAGENYPVRAGHIRSGQPSKGAGRPGE